MAQNSWILQLAFLLSGIRIIMKSKATGLKQVNDYPVQRREGDIIIGGLVLVHTDERSGTQTVEAINMVIDKINQDKRILAGVRLGTMIIDTRKMDSYTLQQIVVKFFPQFSAATGACKAESLNNALPLFAGIIGAATSDISIESAKLLQAFSIPQISYWSTNPTLSDKKLFPYFFRTIPSDLHQAQAIAEFASQQGWNYISVVYEDTHYGSRAYSAIEDSANHKGICVAIAKRMPKLPTTEDFKSVVEKLSTKLTARAVIVFTSHTGARGILKEAANSDVAGKFVWIATDAWTRMLPELADDLAVYESELDGTIGFAPKADPIPGFDDYFTQITLSDRKNSSLNPWFAEFISDLKNCSVGKSSLVPRSRVCDEDEKVVRETFEQFPYNENVANAVLLFAHSLHEVHKQTCKGKSKLCTEMKRMSGTNELAVKAYEIMKNITITGINGGPFKFDENQDAPSDYYVYNYKKEVNTAPGKEKEKWTKVATIDSEGITWLGNLSNKVNQIDSYCAKECKKNEIKKFVGVKCCWTCQPCKDNQYILNGSVCVDCKEGSRPNSSVTGCELMPVEFIQYSKTQSIVSIILGMVGVLLTAMTVAIYVKERNTPIVKASGQELCFATLFGCFLTCINCWTIMAKPNKVSCASSRVILSFGPALMYSALLSKTMRVMVIFRSKILSPKTKFLLQPTSQLVLTGLIFLVQILVVIIWLTISPPKLEIHHINRKFVFLSCETLVDPSIITGLVYPFLLIVICTILATLNRTVPVGFNEAKLIGFTMYSTCVIWLAFVSIFMTSENTYELKHMIVSICLSLSALAVLLCMFGPRCYTILFQSEQNTPQSVMSSSQTPRQSIAKLDNGPAPKTISRKSVVLESLQDG